MSFIDYYKVKSRWITLLRGCIFSFLILSVWMVVSENSLFSWFEREYYTEPEDFTVFLSEGSSSEEDEEDLEDPLPPEYWGSGFSSAAFEAPEEPYSSLFSGDQGHGSVSAGMNRPMWITTGSGFDGFARNHQDAPTRADSVLYRGGIQGEGFVSRGFDISPSQFTGGFFDGFARNSQDALTRADSVLYRGGLRGQGFMSRTTWSEQISLPQFTGTVSDGFAGVAKDDLTRAYDTLYRGGLRGEGFSVRSQVPKESGYLFDGGRSDGFVGLAQDATETPYNNLYRGGGRGQGFAMYTMHLQDSSTMFTGGLSDGFAIGIRDTAVPTPFYTGGRGQGFIQRGMFAQQYVPVEYLGNGGQGFTTRSMPYSYTSLYAGGPSDGFAGRIYNDPRDTLEGIAYISDSGQGFAHYVIAHEKGFLYDGGESDGFAGFAGDTEEMPDDILYRGGVRGQGFAMNSMPLSSSNHFVGSKSDGFAGADTNTLILADGDLYIGGDRGQGFSSRMISRSVSHFDGGISDGFAGEVNDMDTIEYDALYRGGDEGQGFAMNSMPLVASNHFVGGESDGFAGADTNTLIFAYEDLYAGGDGQGFISRMFDLPDMVNYIGGESDGFAGDADDDLTVADPIYRGGGEGQGFVSRMMPSPEVNIFIGGISDGFAGKAIDDLTRADSVLYRGGKGQGFVSFGMDMASSTPYVVGISDGFAQGCYDEGTETPCLEPDPPFECPKDCYPPDCELDERCPQPTRFTGGISDGFAGGALDDPRDTVAQVYMGDGGQGFVSLGNVAHLKSLHTGGISDGFAGTTNPADSFAHIHRGEGGQGFVSRFSLFTTLEDKFSGGLSDGFAGKAKDDSILADSVMYFGGNGGQGFVSRSFARMVTTFTGGASDGFAGDANDNDSILYYYQFRGEGGQGFISSGDPFVTHDAYVGGLSDGFAGDADDALTLADSVMYFGGDRGQGFAHRSFARIVTSFTGDKSDGFAGEVLDALTQADSVMYFGGDEGQGFVSRIMSYTIQTQYSGGPADGFAGKYSDNDSILYYYQFRGNGGQGFTVGKEIPYAHENLGDGFAGAAYDTAILFTPWWYGGITGQGFASRQKAPSPMPGYYGDGGQGFASLEMKHERRTKFTGGLADGFVGKVLDNLTKIDSVMYFGGEEGQGFVSLGNVVAIRTLYTGHISDGFAGLSNDDPTVRDVALFAGDWGQGFVSRGLSREYTAYTGNNSDGFAGNKNDNDSVSYHYLFKGEEGQGFISLGMEARVYSHFVGGISDGFAGASKDTDLTITIFRGDEGQGFTSQLAALPPLSAFVGGISDGFAYIGRDSILIDFVYNVHFTDTVVCLGDTVRFDSITHNGYLDNYYWTTLAGAPLSIINDTTYYHTPTTRTGYQIVITDVHGKEYRDTIFVRVDTLHVTIKEPVLYVCENMGFTVGAETNITSFGTWTWAGGTTNNLVFADTLKAGTSSRKYTLHAVTRYGCEATGSVEVFKRPDVPTIDFASTLASCDNTTAGVIVTPSIAASESGLIASYEFLPSPISVSGNNYTFEILNRTLMVSVLITTDQGCERTDTIELSYEPFVYTRDYDPSPILCDGATLTLPAITGDRIADWTWTVLPEGTVLDKTGLGGTSVHTPTQNTTYAVTIFLTDGCLAFDTVRARTSTIELFTSDDLLVCEGEIFTVSASVAPSGGFTWTFDDKTSVNATVTDSLVGGATRRVYYVNASTALNCLASDSVVVITRPNNLTDADLSFTTRFVYEDGLIYAEITPSMALVADGGVVETYSWSRTPASNTGLTHRFVVAPSENFFVDVFVVDTGGCSRTVRVTMDIDPFVYIPNQLKELEICLGTTISLNGVTGGRGIAEWYWTLAPAGTVLPREVVNSEVTNRTLYTPTLSDTVFILVLKDFQGDYHYDTVHVTIEDVRFEVEDAILTSCGGVPFVVSATLIPAATEYEWTWSPDRLSNSATITDVLLDTIKTQIYYVTATSPGRCRLSTTVTVNRLEVPEVSFDHTVLCNAEGTATVVTVTPSIPAGSTDVLEYIFTPAPISVDGNTYTFSMPGSPIFASTLDIRVEIISTDGCGQVPQTIRASRPAFTVRDLSPRDTLICGGGSVRLPGMTGSGIAEWYWKTENGTVLDLNDGISTHQPESSTYYVVTTTSTMGCVVYDTLHVAAEPKLELNLPPTQMVCDNEPFTLTAAPSLPATLVWTLAGGATSTGLSITDVLATGVPQRIYSVTGRTAIGCEVTESTQVVKHNLQISGVTFTHEFICDGTRSLVKVTPSQAASPMSSIHAFNFTPAPISRDDNVYTFEFPVGSYLNLKTVITDANGCQTNADDYAIYGIPTNISYRLRDTTICYGAQVILPTVTGEGIADWYWSNIYGDRLMKYGGLSYDRPNAADSLYILTIISEMCVARTDTLRVSIQDFWLDVVKDFNVCEGSVFTVGGLTSHPAYVEWTWGDGQMEPNLWFTSQLPEGVTEMIFTATARSYNDLGGMGCMATDKVVVRQIPEGEVVEIMFAELFHTDAQGEMYITITPSIVNTITNGVSLYEFIPAPIDFAGNSVIYMIPEDGFCLFLKSNDPSGCIESKEVCFRRPGFEHVRTTRDTTICEGGTVTLNSFVGKDVKEWWWEILPDGTRLEPEGDDSTSYHSPLETTVYALVMIDSNDREHTYRITATVEIPTVEFLIDTIVCLNTQITVDVQLSPDVPAIYTWTYGGKTEVAPIRAIFDRFTEEDFVGRTYIVDVVTASTCTVTDSITIKTYPEPPRPDFTHTFEGTDYLTIMSITPSIPAGPDSEVLSYTFSPWSTVKPDGSYDFLIDHYLDVNVRIEDANGCFRDTLLRYALSPFAHSRNTFDQIVCEGNEIMLDTFLGIGVEEWYWVALANAVTEKDDTLTKEADGRTYHAPLVTTTYQLVMIDSNGRVYRSNVVGTVTPHDTLVVQFNQPNNLDICEGTPSVTYVPTVTRGGLSPQLSYLWTTEDDFSFVRPDSLRGVIRTQDLAPGEYEFNLRIRSTRACVGDLDTILKFRIVSRPQFEELFERDEDLMACKNYGVPVSVQITSGTVSWSGGLWQDISEHNDGTAVILSPTTRTRYIATVTNATDCFARDTVWVDVQDCPLGGTLSIYPWRRSGWWNTDLTWDEVDALGRPANYTEEPEVAPKCTGEREPSTIPSYADCILVGDPAGYDVVAVDTICQSDTVTLRFIGLGWTDPVAGITAELTWLIDYEELTSDDIMFVDSSFCPDHNAASLILTNLPAGRVRVNARLQMSETVMFQTASQFITVVPRKEAEVGITASAPNTVLGGGARFEVEGDSIQICENETGLLFTAISTGVAHLNANPTREWQYLGYMTDGEPVYGWVQIAEPERRYTWHVNGVAQPRWGDARDTAFLYSNEDQEKERDSVWVEISVCDWCVQPGIANSDTIIVVKRPVPQIRFETVDNSIIAGMMGSPYQGRFAPDTMRRDIDSVQIHALDSSMVANQLVGVRSVTWATHASIVDRSAIEDTIIVRPTVNTTYTATLVNEFYCTATGTLTIHVLQPPAITLHPTNREICETGDAWFGIAKTGDGNLTVEWNRRDQADADSFALANSSSASNPNPWFGVDTDTLFAGGYLGTPLYHPLAPGNVLDSLRHVSDSGSYYFARVWSDIPGFDTVKSNEARLNLIKAESINAGIDPELIAGCLGDELILHLTSGDFASGDGTEYTIIWYVKMENGSESMRFSNGMTFRPTNLLPGDSVRAIVTSNKICLRETADTTEWVGVEVSMPPTVQLTLPTIETVCENLPAEVIAGFSESQPNAVITWYINDEAQPEKTLPEGAISDTFRFAAIPVGATTIRFEYTFETPCSPKTVSSQTLIVPTIQGNTIASTQTIIPGNMAADLNSAVAGQPVFAGGTLSLAYQWQRNIGDGWVDAGTGSGTGAGSGRGINLNPNPVNIVTNYRRIVMAGACRDTSNEIRIGFGEMGEVTDTLGRELKDTLICWDDTLVLQIRVAGTDDITWQQSVDGTVWSSVGSSTSTVVNGSRVIHRYVVTNRANRFYRTFVETPIGSYYSSTIGVNYSRPVLQGKTQWDTIVCVGTDVNLWATVNDQSRFWITDSDKVDIGAQDAVVTRLIEADAMFYIRMMDTLNCQIFDSIRVVAGDTTSPQISLEVDKDVICSDGSVTFTATPSTMISGATLAWRSQPVVGGVAPSTFATSGLTQTRTASQLNGNNIWVELTYPGTCRNVNPAVSEQIEVEVVGTVTQTLNIYAAGQINPATVAVGSDGEMKFYVEVNNRFTGTGVWTLNGTPITEGVEATVVADTAYFTGLREIDTVRYISTSTFECVISTSKVVSRMVIIHRNGSIADADGRKFTDTAVCLDEALVLQVADIEDGHTWRWQRSTNATSSYSSMTSYGTADYTADAQTTYYYRAQVNTGIRTYYTTPVRVVISRPVLIDKTPWDTIVCVGTDVNLWATVNDQSRFWITDSDKVDIGAQDAVVTRLIEADEIFYIRMMDTLNCQVFESTRVIAGDTTSPQISLEVDKDVICSSGANSSVVFTASPSATIPGFRLIWYSQPITGGYPLIMEPMQLPGLPPAGLTQTYTASQLNGNYIWVELIYPGTCRNVNPAVSEQIEVEVVNTVTQTLNIYAAGQTNPATVAVDSKGEMKFYVAVNNQFTGTGVWTLNSMPITEGVEATVVEDTAYFIGLKESDTVRYISTSTFECVTPASRVVSRMVVVNRNGFITDVEGRRFTDTSVCANEALLLTIAELEPGYTWRWQRSTNGTSWTNMTTWGSNQPTYAANATTTYYYRARVRTENAARNYYTDAVRVVISRPVLTGKTRMDTLVCIGTDANLWVTVNDKSSYWIADGGENENISRLIEGNTTFSVILHDSLGCEVRETIRVLAGDTISPEVSITVSKSDICATESVVFTATTSAMITGAQLSWHQEIAGNSSPIVGQTGTTLTRTATQVEDRHIWAQLTYPGTCRNVNPAISNSIEVDVTPTAIHSMDLYANGVKNPNAPIVIPSDGPMKFYVATTNQDVGGGVWTMNGQPVNPADVEGDTLTVNAAKQGYYITYTSTSNVYCVNTRTLSRTVFMQGNAYITLSDGTEVEEISVCANTVLKLRINELEGVQDWRWRRSANNGASWSTVHSYAASGVEFTVNPIDGYLYVAQVRATDGRNYYTNPIRVNISRPVLYGQTPNGTVVCVGDEIELMAEVGPKDTFYIADGAANTFVIKQINTNQTFPIRVVDTLGCEITSSISIVAGDTVTPKVSISVNKDVICANESVVFTATTSGLISGAQLIWHQEIGGNTSPIAGQTGTTLTRTAAQVVGRRIWAQLTYPNPYGCREFNVAGSEPIEVEVNPILTHSVDLYANGIKNPITPVAVPADGIMKFYVEVLNQDDGEGVWTLNGIAVDLANVDHDTLTLSGLVQGDQVRYTSTSTWSCIDFEVVTRMVNISDNAYITTVDGREIEDTAVCSGEIVTLKIDNLAGVQDWRWVRSTNGTSWSAVTSYATDQEFNTDGTTGYFYAAQVRTTNGRTYYTNPIRVLISTPTLYYKTPNTTVCVGDEMTLEVEVGPKDTFYIADAAANTFVTTIIESTQTFAIRMVDTLGCVLTNSIQITALDTTSPEISITVDKDYICSSGTNSSVVFTATTSGMISGSTLTWRQEVLATGDTSDISSGVATTLTRTAAQVDGRRIWAELTYPNACRITNPAVSNSLEIDVETTVTQTMNIYAAGQTNPATVIVSSSTGDMKFYVNVVNRIEGDGVWMLNGTPITEGVEATIVEDTAYFTGLRDNDIVRYVSTSTFACVTPESKEVARQVVILRNAVITDMTGRQFIDTVACANEALLLTISGLEPGYTWRWQRSTNGTSWTNMTTWGSNQPTYAANATTTYYYRARVRTENAARNYYTDAVRVVISRPVLTGKTRMDTLVCIGTDANLWVTVNDKSSYWIADGGENENISRLIEGNTTFSVILHDSLGCEVRETIRVLAGDTISPEVSITVSKSDICATESVVFTATTSAMITGAQLSWHQEIAGNSSPIVGQTGTTLTRTATQVEDRHIWAQLTYPGTCRNVNPAISNSIEVDVTPTAIHSMDLYANGVKNPNAPIVIPSDGPMKFYVATTNQDVGGGVWTMNGQPVNPADVEGDTLTVNAAKQGYYITYTSTSNVYCVNTRTLSRTVFMQGNAYITLSDGTEVEEISVCANTVLKLRINELEGVQDWRWRRSANNGASWSTVHSYAASGVEFTVNPIDGYLYVAQVRATDGRNYYTNPIRVNISRPVLYGQTPNGTVVCVGDEIELMAEVGPKDTFYIADGAANTFVIKQINTNQTFPIRVVDTLGCEITSSISIVAGDTVTPKVSISVNKDVICANESVVFTATTSGLISGAQLIWHQEIGGNTSPIAGQTGTTLTRTAAQVVGRRIWAQLTYPNPYGCREFNVAGSEPIEVEVNPILTHSVDLYANGIKNPITPVAVPADGIMKFYVEVLNQDDGEGVWTLNGIAVDLANVDHDTLTLSGLVQGDQVRYTSTSTWSCIDFEVVTRMVNISDNAYITTVDGREIEDTAVCSGEIVTLKIDNLAGVQDWRWVRSTNGTSWSAVTSYATDQEFNTDGTTGYFYAAQVRTTNGRTYYTNPIRVLISTPTLYYKTPNTTVCVGDEMTLEVEVGPKDTFYIADAAANTFVTTIIESTQTFAIRMVDTLGCVLTNSIQITALDTTSPEISITVDKDYICSSGTNSSVVFTATTSGMISGATLTWRQELFATGDTTNISSGTSTTLTRTAAQVDGRRIWAELTYPNACRITNPAVSNSLEIEVETTVTQTMNIYAAGQTNPTIITVPSATGDMQFYVSVNNRIEGTGIWSLNGTAIPESDPRIVEDSIFLSDLRENDRVTYTSTSTFACVTPASATLVRNITIRRDVAVTDEDGREFGDTVVCLNGQFTMYAAGLEAGDSWTWEQYTCWREWCGTYTYYPYNDYYCRRCGFRTVSGSQNQPTLNASATSNAEYRIRVVTANGRVYYTNPANTIISRPVLTGKTRMDTVVCVGADAYLWVTVNNKSSYWIADGGENENIYRQVNSNNTSFQIIYRDSLGCELTDVIRVRTADTTRPSISITVDETTLCNNDRTVFRATIPTPRLSGSTIVWKQRVISTNEEGPIAGQTGLTLTR
ncbi:MAG: hypothetical protein FWG79_00410, partial [Bacteroidales bacterium]|nr:hypothetical protein [Bacteroidales bacterium]